MLKLIEKPRFKPISRSEDYQIRNRSADSQVAFRLLPLVRSLARFRVQFCASSLSVQRLYKCFSHRYPRASPRLPFRQHSASIPLAFPFRSSAAPRSNLYFFTLSSIFSRPYFCYSSFDSPGPPPKSSRCHPPRPSAAFWSESCSDYSSARRCRTLPTGKCASPVRKCHFQSVYKCLVEFSFVLRE